MRVGLDFDGVIADTYALKAFYGKKLFDVEITPEYQKEKKLHDAGILSRENYRNLMALICSTEIGLEASPIEGSLETINLLQSKQHQLSIITSRNEKESEIARKWCVQHSILLPIISVGYGKSKKNAAAGLQAYLDDDFEKLQPLADTVPHLHLLHAPHNKDVIVEPIAERVFSWQEFALTLEKLS